MKLIKSEKSSQKSVNEDNLHSSKGEELIQRTELQNTPFVVVGITDPETDVKKWFGTMGAYRITEDYDSQSKVETELSKVTWNRIMQVIGILLDHRDHIIKLTKSQEQ